mmetsp:Transcript_29561/g.91395  ORF Transcript_29561/g.91395 Transcript_29561/m.91395 type:complete len:442 (+) Transcript_29561:130-1455(+)
MLLGRRRGRDVMEPLQEPLVDADDDAVARSRVNVRAIQIFWFVTNVSRGIWQGQLLTVFLASRVSDRMTDIGLIEGAQGIARFASAVLAGVLADRLAGRRNVLLRGAAAFGIVVHAACGYLVLSPRSAGLAPWYVLTSLYACLVSVQAVVVESLFADSTPSGDRVRDYTTKRLCQQAGQLAGPMLQLLAILGGTTKDVWSQHTTTELMLIGIGIGAASCVLMLSMDQRRTLDGASEANHLQPTDGEATVSEATARRVRYTIFIYDLLRVLAGGVAVKFIGVYFVKVHDLNPSQFLVLTFAAQAVMLLSVAAAGRLAARFPRERVCFGLLLAVDAGNFLLALARGTWWQAAGWVSREGANAGIFGLKQTILMDHCAKRDRGKWNSVDGLQSSFWSGSAMVRGRADASTRTIRDPRRGGRVRVRLRSAAGSSITTATASISSP